MRSIDDILRTYGAASTSAQPSGSDMPISAEDAYDAVAGIRTGAGGSSENEVQRDMITMSPGDILLKYGPREGARILTQRAKAETAYTLDATSARRGREIIGDTTRGAIRGVVGSVGGIAGLGVGLFSDEGGTTVSGWTDSANEWISDFDSAGLRNRQNANQARNRMDQIDSDAKFERDRATDGDFVAGLRRIGRDIVNTATNLDGATAGNVVAEGAGSLLTGGPVIKGVGVAGKGVTTLLRRGGILGRRGKVIADAAVRAGSPAAGVALLESGGAYNQTVNEVMSMDPDVLMEQSPDFRELVLEGGMTYDQAKRELANSAGLEAAAITAPAAALIGAPMGRFASNPLARTSGGRAVSNILGEALEESAQGSVSQMATNVALDTVDPNRALSEGVGEQAALGAIGGLGSASVTTSPSLAAASAKTAGKAALWGVGKAADSIISRYERVIEENRKASSVSEEVVDTQLNDALSNFEAKVAAAAPVEDIEAAAEPTSAKPSARAYEEQLYEAARFDAGQLDESIPAPVREALSGTTNSLQAMQTLYSILQGDGYANEEKVAAAVLMSQISAKVRDVTEAVDAPEVRDLADDDQLKTSIAGLTTALTNLKTNNVFKNAVNDAKLAMGQAVEAGTIRAVTDAELLTAEGQAQIQNAIAVAEFAPEKSSMEANEAILQHANNGKIQLTPNQTRFLMAANALLNAEREVIEANKEGLDLVEDYVSGQIISDRTSGQPDGYPSLSEHLSRLTRSYRAGDTDAAREYLADLMAFARHAQNKVAALNEHIARGGGPKETGNVYDAKIPGRTAFKPSPDKLYVQPTNERSVRLAQKIGREAAIIGRTANKFAEIFQDLGIEQEPLVLLSEELQGNPADLVANARAKVKESRGKKASEKFAERKQAQENKKTEPAQETKPEPEAAPVEQKAEQLELDLAPVEETQPDSEVSVDATETETEVAQEAETESEALPKAETEEAVTPQQPEMPEVPQITEIEEAVVAAVDKAFAEAAAQQEEQVEDLEPVQSEITEVDPKDVLTYFPNLSNGKDNLFVQGYQMPENPTSILATALSPLRAAFSALQSNRPELIEAYEEFFGMAGALSDRLNARLRAFLNKKEGKKKTLTNGERFLAGEKLGEYARAKAVHLTDNVDGKLAYNQQLLEGAIVAALQWSLIATGRVPRREAEDIYDLIPEIGQNQAEAILSAREEAILSDMKTGLTTLEAVTSLTETIQRYWGLQARRDAPIGDTVGIAEAIAKELLTVMVDANMLEQIDVLAKNFDGKSPIVLKSKDGRKEFSKEIVIFRPKKLDDADPIKSSRDLIERAVMGNKAKRPNWVGSPPSSVAKTQLANSRVPHTKQQIATIRNRQNVPYKLNSMMLSFYDALGIDRILEAFAGGAIDADNTNEAHRLTLEGRNTTFRSAWETAQDLVAEIRQKAEEDGIPEEDVPVYFEYAFNRTNRLQQLGANNPQASKLVREILLPTRYRGDFSLNSENAKAFFVAIGQHIGQKIEKVSPDQAMADVMKKLAEPQYQAAIAGLDSWLETGRVPDGQIEDLKTALGSDMSPVAVHSLLEYARWLRTPLEDRKNFETALYLEADGKTNGPINAMALFSIGEFTADWIANMRKGGLTVGEHEAYHQTADKSDLYQTASDILQRLMGSAINNMVPKVRAQSEQVLWLMDQFFGRDLQFNAAEGTLTVDRGLVKNPLTITLYGSGKKGIANKLTKALSDKISERMTTALQAMADADGLITAAEALFPNSADPDADMERFKEAIDDLLMKTLVTYNDKRTGKKITAVFNNKEAEPNKLNRTFKKFVLEGGVFENFSRNIQHVIVENMSAAIAETVGGNLMQSLEVLKGATNTHSTILGAIFKKKVEAKIAEKKAAGTYRDSSFLSQAELDEIFDSMKDLMPVISTGEQNFLVAGNQTANLSDEFFSTTLDSKLPTEGLFDGLGSSGVRGVPFFVIGSGDGYMMQYFGAFQDWAQRTLDVYDGLNVPLDGVSEFSQRANTAVHASWKRNPLAGLSEAFSKFAENVNLGQFTAVELEQLAKEFRMDPEAGNIAEGLEVLIESYVERLNNNAMSAQARINALARVNLSVDQMTGYGSPHIEDGKISMVGLSNEDKATLLTELYYEELDKLMADEERIQRGDPEVIAPQDIKLLTDKLGIKGEQKILLDDVADAAAKLGYSIVRGSLEQVNRFLAKQGLKTLDNSDRKINGATMPSQRLILLVDPTNEVTFHELIHAATYEKVAAYYAGQNLVPNSVEQVRAIQRLEALMEQFLGLDVTNESDAVVSAYADALESILERQRKGDKAGALNEFMAWGLANQDLAQLQSKTQATGIGALVRKAVDAIRRIVFGKRRSTAVLGDMLTNLRFNTQILAVSQLDRVTDMRGLLGETSLYHSQAYGTDERLEEINRLIDAAVLKHVDAKFMNVDKDARDIKAARFRNEMLTSTELAAGQVASIFPMTKQQIDTFHLVMAVLQSAVELNPNALEKAGEMYSHFTKVATNETFMENPDLDDPNDRYQARQKYQLMLGNIEMEYDKMGRSSLLPMFLATTMVHPEMREALSRLPLPENQKNTSKTLDALLENAGTSAMTKLGNYLAGVSGQETNVAEVMDALIEQMLKTAEERRGFVGTVADTVDARVNQADDFVAAALERGSQALRDKAKQIESNTDNKFVKTAAQAASVMAGIANRKIGDDLAQELISSVNQVPQLPKVISDLIVDLVGRTGSNAPVYDLIKRVRNWVQQRRQQFREHLPAKIAEQFSRELTDAEWAGLYRSIGKTDLVALKRRFINDEIIDLARQPTRVREEIQKIEAELRALQPIAWPKIQEKSRQLANFMNTGVYGSNLLRNSDAISALLMEPKPAKYQQIGNQEQLIDVLVSLYALNTLPAADRDLLADMAANETGGVKFVLSYMSGLQKEETRKKSEGGMALYNSYKGFIPAEPITDGSLIVASDNQFEELRAKSYVRVADYTGSDLERGADSRGYYFVPVSARSKYQQGVLQTVQHTAGGVDIRTGRTHGPQTSGLIEDPVQVRRAAMRMARETAVEPLSPIYDQEGQVVAFERTIDPERRAMIRTDQNLARAMGVWRGRQVEEAESRQVNRILIQRMKAIYDQDMAKGVSKEAEYVDLFDSKQLKKDPVLADTMNSIPGNTLADIAAVFGNNFYVRRDMLNDALGYRDASVRNLWDGISRLNPQATNTMRKVMIAVMGNDAFKMATKAEEIVKNVVTDLRVLIVVKSVVVPMANLTWNVGQLMARGVPLTTIARGFPGKVSEVNEYLKTRQRLIDAEAEYAAAESDLFRRQKLKAEIQEIQDRHRRLSIWPLIEAGELTSISDSTVSEEDLKLSEGRLVEYVERLTDRLPAQMKTMAKYGLVTKDTALFKGLQRAIEYGDFLGKAVLYEDLTKRKGMSQDDALAMVSEEFVNYDRLPGRSRGYVEQIGLLWFWNFKIRSTKVALSMLRNNPLRSLMLMTAPVPDFLGPVGSPLADNAINVVANGSWNYSVGWDMGFNAPQLNPWWNLTN